MKNYKEATSHMNSDELQCLYTNAIEMSKHFHARLDKHRFAVITVGIVAITASGKIIIDGKSPIIALAISFWELIFVVSLWFRTHNMRRYSIDCVFTAAEIEEKLCDKAGISSSIMQDIKNEHKCLANRSLFKRFIDFFQRYGTFLIMAIACLCVFFYSLTIIW